MIPETKHKPINLQTIALKLLNNERILSELANGDKVIRAEQLSSKIPSLKSLGNMPLIQLRATEIGNTYLIPTIYQIEPRSIPYETISSPGHIVLYDLSQPPAHLYKAYALSILDPNNVEIQEKFLTWKAQPAIMQEHIEWSMWMCALGWLYKKRWNPKYKLAEISRNKKERDLLEPFSDLLHSALLLCEQCYLYVDKFGYDHHLIWFHSVALELQRFGLNCPQGKEKLVIKLREAAKNLRDNQNPIDPSQYPALWQLMEASLALADSNLDRGFRSDVLPSPLCE